MVLESTMVLIDNSEFQRNGDYVPTRLVSQKDCSNILVQTKLRAHPESNVGLMTIAGTIEVLCTFTNDAGRLYTKVHAVQPKGNINLITGLRIAHLALKHRLSKNHRMRIVVFVGSPLLLDKEELMALAKRMKKEKVSVDFISFGQHPGNDKLLESFVEIVHSKDGNNMGSHLLTVPRGFTLSDMLIHSAIIRGEDGNSGPAPEMFEYDFDPNYDPELALALRISMDEQRAMQEIERARNSSANETTSAAVANVDTNNNSDNKKNETSPVAIVPANDENTSPNNCNDPNCLPDFQSMTEEEQIAYAMNMSLQSFSDGNCDDSDAPCEPPSKKGRNGDQSNGNDESN